MRNSSKRSTAFVWVATVLVCLWAAFAFATRPSRQDSFRFLEGRSPFATGAFAPLGCYLGYNDGSASLTEYRAYSWSEDYKTTKALVSEELKALGYHLTYDKGHFCTWAKKDEVEVLIQYGRTYTKEEAIIGTGPKRPGVTIITSNDVPDTLVNKFRSWIEPSY